MWEDIAIAAGNAVFIVAILPSFRQPPHFLTAAGTAIALAAFVASYAALHMVIAAVTTSTETALWALLAVQAARGVHAESRTS